jgi:hypothetical protein
MLSSIQLLPGVDVLTGAFALSVFVAGAAVAVVIVLGVVAFRRAGQAGTNGMLWRGALVLVGALLAWTLLGRSSSHDEFAAERRAIETRAAELTARAVTPGSALACLDAVASAAVENACEKALFVSPEAVAAAAAYVDARLSLFLASSRLAARDRSYRPPLERMRRAIEADRFGLVAHVLMTRGCNAADCADLKRLSDPRRVLANMKTRRFEARVAIHAAAWTPGGAAVATAMTPPPSLASVPPQRTPAPMPAATTGAASPPTISRLPSAHQTAPGSFDYPSAASIPPVSIMSAEPPADPAAEPAAEPAPQPSRPAPRGAAPPPKRPQAQAARRPQPRSETPSAPLSVVPPPPATTMPLPQITGTR